MKFLEHLGNYLLSGSFEAHLTLGFISLLILSFITVMVHVKFEKKDKVKKEFEELEKRCGTMH